MDFKECLALVEGFKNQGKSIEDVVNEFSKKQVYHTLLVNALRLQYRSIPEEEIKEIVYSNKHFSKFKTEKNPFNEELNRIVEDTKWPRFSDDGTSDEDFLE